jgi:hypothetical protein
MFNPKLPYVWFNIIICLIHTHMGSTGIVLMTRILSAGRIAVLLKYDAIN